MSIKRMVTKLALAFAAKKGMDAVRSAGGLEGIKNALQNRDAQPTSSQTAHSRGDVEPAGSPDILSSILGSLNGANTTQRTESTSIMDQSFGSMLGTLASALGHRSDTETAAADVEAEMSSETLDTDAESGPVLRAMVQMARADGAISDAEQQTLMEILDDATTQEKATLRNAMQEPIDPNAIAADTPAHARKEVYSGALLVGNPDTFAEKKFLSELAAALGLTHEEVSRLHHAMGKPAV
ncbi:tellurite resistance TerB family protein [Roseobacter sp. CCS2]|uniref:tellurite resistance TerB family protein n=1 Tax=Roseobacter sp. CCS2 TaxID=391593 RepID=UPI0002EF89E5|nr:tellurite resistance TerB family protein [Roseobacter sp. CCS2]